ncbi:hypothetical protein AAFC00_007030 [Neodothiora populina]|uniref:Uncharacterized protein n=1 Tax=Neodothiora populina TaxID=2781224 RepID=A0ABR3PC29_9PEZI
MAQNPQDELAQLFERNMIFSQPLPQYPTTPDKQFHMQTPAQAQIIYSSQHYTGAYHYSPVEPVQEARVDSPMSFPVDDLTNILLRNDIDPASLSPSQSKLFADADSEQRLRLLELWRISPPDNESHDRSDLAVWPLTSLAQEEESARLRYEKRLNSQTHESVDSQEAEPYVVAGYANPQRLEPVYAAAAAGMWQQAPSYNQAIQAMELQYGAYQQAQHMEHMQAQHDDMVM